jgi:hypothetical protein
MTFKDGNYKGYLQELELWRTCVRNDFSNNKQYACWPNDKYEFRENRFLTKDLQPCDYNNYSCNGDSIDFRLDSYILNPADDAYKKYNCPIDYHKYINNVKL